MPGSNTIATTQIALGADVAESLYGVTGAELKIGIISDSFNASGGAAADRAAGILPTVTVLNDGAGSDEGRAMIELAYSIAPGATYLTADGGSLADNVTALKNAGANIIVDDLSVGGEALYQLGSDTDVAIEAAVASGVDYFTSAGNNGNDYYEQGFKPITTTIPGVGTFVANDFGGGSPYLSLTLPANSGTNLQFQFAQPFGSFGAGSNSPTNSLALLLLDSSGAVVATSITNDIGGDPVQTIDFKNTTTQTAYRLVVVQNGGTVPSGELFKFFLNNNIGTINSPNAGKGSGDLLGHEMLPNINVLGSVAYTATPAYGTSPSVIDAASSVGPGLVLFDAQGHPITPVTEGVPQFDAPDGTLTGSANTNFAASAFFGTSAAAPAAGAVGALVLQADAALTTAQVTAVLGQSVIPVTVYAPASGAGLIQARAAVEIASAAAGSSWIASSGGNWNSAANWTTAPTPAASVFLGNNLGGFTASYTTIVNTAGDAAGSLAIGATTGSSASLSVQGGGALAIGGSATNDRTAGDLLVSGNGTLAETGGTVTIAGSLNVNNGTVMLSAGSLTADNYAQDAGSFTLGGGASATVSLTGSGFNQTGGTASILAGGKLTTLSLADSAALLSVAGTLIDAGALSSGVAGGAAVITLLAGGMFTIGGTATGVGIGFGDGGTLVFGSSNATTLESGLTSVISGFDSAADAVDFSGLTYLGTDQATYANGRLDLTDGVNTLASLSLAPAAYGMFSVTHDANNHPLISLACFCPGTRIATPDGEAAIESLAIGDPVLTASGQTRRIIWIGRRSYMQRFLLARPLLLPVRIRAGALGAGLPRRDLVVSPEHAMWIDGVLVPARLLVNGTTVVRDRSAERVSYLHIELADHDLILAEGAATETFVDDDSREAFHNAAEFHVLYPGRTRRQAAYCAPRVEGGFALEAIRRRLQPAQAA